MIKLIHRHWQKRWEKYYRHNRWHLLLDLFLIIIIITLAISALELYLYNPSPGQLDYGRTPRVVSGEELLIDFSVASSAIDINSQVNLRVNLRNRSQEKITGLKISLLLIDKDSFSLDPQEFSIPDLSAQENRQDEYQFNFKRLNPQSKDINWQAQLEYLIGGQAIKKALALPSLKLISSLELSSVAYYHSPQGDQLGAGPLPPIVDLPTNYWIFWNITNDGSFHDLVVSARLPQGVELTNNRSLLAGDLNYNSSTRQIIWKIKDLKTSEDAYRVGFEVQLTPKREQIGKIVPLISNLQYFAQDTAAKKEVSGELSNLTSNLDFDKINKGTGTVSD